jgi:hypothetical protein
MARLTIAVSGTLTLDADCIAAVRYSALLL